MFHSEPQVHWHEGMFLRPHHLQSTMRHVQGALAFRSGLAGPGRWGFADLDINDAKLETFEFQINSASAIFPDGDHFVMPMSGTGTGRVLPRKFKDAFETCGGRLPVYLGIPKRIHGRPVAGQADSLYDVELVDLDDENTFDPNARKKLEIRFIRGQIVFGDDRTQAEFSFREEASHLQVMKIAEIVRDDDVAARPRRSTDYVPPLLHVAADEPFRLCLQEISDILKGQNASLARELASREIARGIETGKESDQFLKLHATNTFVPVIEQLCRTAGVHPFDAYLALCQLLGHLAYFGPGRRCPDVAVYDHDDLGPRFADLCAKIKGLLEKTVPRDYEKRAFEPTSDPRVWEAEFDPRWLDPEWGLYLGVARGHTSGERLEPGPAALNLGAVMGSDLKLAASKDRDNIFGNIVPGIALTQVPYPPASMPHNDDETYYKLDEQKTAQNDPVTGTERWGAMRIDNRLSVGWARDPLSDVAIHLYAAKVR